jgi:FkbM family methyltransferase
MGTGPVHALSVNASAAREPAPDLVPIRVTAMGTPLSLLVRPGTLDEYIVREVLATYHIEELVRCHQHRDHVTVFDVGGHIGTFSIVIATLLPQSRVYVFEPVEANYQVLVRNIEHAGLAGRVYPKNAAVAGRDGYVSTSDIALSPDARNTGGHVVGLGRLSVDRPGNGQPPLEVSALTTLLDGADVDVLKIDCEGAEFEILYSLPAPQFDRIATMVGEIHSCDGFAGMTTNDREWNSAALVPFLRNHYRTVTVDQRLRTSTALLETFCARR